MSNTIMDEKQDDASTRHSLVGRRRPDRLRDREWLGAALKALGITQTRLAEEWGTDPSTVSRWVSRRGVTDDVLTFKRAITLAQMLGLPLNTLAEKLGWAEAGSLPVDGATVLEEQSQPTPMLPMHEHAKAEVWSVTLNPDATATVVIHASIPGEDAAPLVAAMAAAVKKARAT